ncbi:MAG TPA: glycine oxidase ThiO [Acidimicrobiales bacterium]|nr:glycine oxidase ThiO [Acidimicrobiales bacterium]
MRPDVAVVGGGAIGLACAWRAAQRGLSVTVVDPAPGSGASHVAAGMLCPVTEVHYGEEPLLALTLESARRWPSFAHEVEAASGVDVGHRTEGTIAVAFDEDDLRALEDLLRFQQSLGLTVERLRSRDCRVLEPQLSPRVRGGLLVSGDHQVDNRRLVTALLDACARAGVRFEHRRVDSLSSVSAERVVLAAGSWSAELDDVPVRPVKGQILRLRFDPDDAPLSRNVRGFAQGRSVYLVPRVDGELVVGATVEEQGFDTSVTAGAVYDLLCAATDLVPGVAELELVESIAGLRPGTPDNAPVIGVSPRDPRVVYATGHYRNGILLTPVTADAVASLLIDGCVPAVVAPFGVERFSR